MLFFITDFCKLLEMKLKEKHISFFELINVMSSNECPLCFLLKDKIKKYFEDLLYENINDIPFRENFRKNYGFCNYHTIVFASHNDSLAMSLVYSDLLSEVVRKIKDKEKKFIPKEKKCIVCQQIEEMEQRYISIICSYLDDEEFKQKLQKSFGFCIPHLEMIINHINKVPQWFLDFHLNRYEKILKSSEKYIDSCNFAKGKKVEISKEEKLVWRDLIKMLYKINI